VKVAAVLGAVLLINPALAFMSTLMGALQIKGSSGFCVLFGDKGIDMLFSWEVVTKQFSQEMPACLRAYFTMPLGCAATIT
jgi:hypothetical protein